MTLRKLKAVIRKKYPWIVSVICLVLIMGRLQSFTRPKENNEIIENKIKIPVVTKRQSPNVTIFHLNEEINVPECVPLKVPKSDSTTSLCIRRVEEDDIISSAIRQNGTWKDNYLKRMANFFAANKNGQLIDLGCNIGVFTVYAAGMGMPVLAVDGLPSNLALLKVSLFHNDAHRLGVHEDFLVNYIKQEETKLQLKDNPNGVGNDNSQFGERQKYSNLVTVLHNVVSNSREQIKISLEQKKEGGTHSSILVDTICLDDLIPYVKPGRPAVFLKLDVQGAEAKVIQCGSKFFQEVDVKVITQTVPMFRTEKERKEIANFLTKLLFVPFHDTLDRRILSTDEVMQWPDNVFWIKSWMDLHQIFGNNDENKANKDDKDVNEAPPMMKVPVNKVIEEENVGGEKKMSIEEIFGIKKGPFDGA